MSATAEEDELSGARSGVQREDGSATASVNVILRVEKIVTNRRPPLLLLPNNALRSQSAFLSTLTNATVPAVVSTSFTSKTKGLPRRPPSSDHCLDNLTGEVVMGLKTATAAVNAVPADRYCGDALHL